MARRGVKLSVMTELADLIRRRLAGRTRRMIRDPASRPAAVLIPLHADRGEPAVLFTRRTETVEHHKGQISFPGGAVDDADLDAPSTALRETEEELGISRDRVEILGLLDDVLASVSGFVITPVVGLIPSSAPLRVNAAEIAEVLTVPLRVFRDPSAMRIERRERDGRAYDVYFYTHGPYEIWGVTGYIMKAFIDAVFGEMRA